VDLHMLKGFVVIGIQPSDSYNPEAVASILKKLFNYHMRGATSMEEKRRAIDTIGKLVSKYCKDICRAPVSDDELTCLPQVKIRKAFELSEEFLGLAGIMTVIGYMNGARRFVCLSDLELEGLRVQYEQLKEQGG